ncbi:hypothetical protein [Hoylesella oralis]|uniref:hypothetical protein n=1 Tax=Hoylesella oralis TaxID=28134 RepID=UPI0003D319BE|nr:hypothetical protein HMPREF1199_01408 [Hoylesella oralis CC98A]
MKTTKKETIQRLGLSLLVLVLAALAWAQAGGGNEVSISSAAEWKAFCERVRNGERGLNAKLTQDVDLGTEIVMLGDLTYLYTGTFDGQGHTLKMNWNAGNDYDIAPFQRVENATIKNLRTQGKITSSRSNLSGLVGYAYGATKLTGCASDVDITGGGSWIASQAAGMVLVVADEASVQITDCLVKGSITDNAWESRRAMAGFVYANVGGTCTMIRCLYVGKNNAEGESNSKTFAPDGTTLTDCYYLNACGEAQGTQVSEAQVKYGALGYKLQAGRTDNIWGQTILTDNEPLPTALARKHVYKVDFTYNGNTVSRYTNGGGNIVGGMPTAKELVGADFDETKTYTMVFDGGFEASTPVTADITVPVQITAHVNDVAISTAADWKAFCQRVNGGEHNLNGRLTQDIDLGTEFVQVGSYFHPYVGTFDGQNHTLKINWQGEAEVAPFHTVENGAVIKNLRIKGKITVDEHNTAGLAYAVYGNVTISNCITDVDITGGRSGDPSNAGGLISGVASAHLTITDCVVMGSITDRSEESVRQLAGFIYTDWADCTMTNCLYLGTNNASDNGKCHTFFRRGGTVENCYYLNASGTLQGEQVTAEQLKSGEVAYKLQAGRPDQVWGQTLGTDNLPLLNAFDATAQHVYKVDFTYNDFTGSRYANNARPVFGGLPTAKDILGTGYNPQNTYTMIFDGGNFTAETLVTEDKTVPVSMAAVGTFEIATKDDWKVLCGLVAGGHTGLNAKLTQDVDLGEDIVRLGSSVEQYTGTFDGQGHTLTVNWEGEGVGAPFNYVDGGTIQNLCVKGKITTSGGGASGLLSYANGTTKLSNCVSDVDITSSRNGACQAAGLIQLVGYNTNVTVTDCVVKGNINATTEEGRKGMAGFVYDNVGGSACTLTNCLYLGENNATENSFTFAPAGVTLNNCNYLYACGTLQGDKVSGEQLKSGYVAHKLQAGRAENVWGQTLGTDDEPQLDATATKRVYKVDFTYNGNTATRYANSGGAIFGGLPKAKELAGTDYNPLSVYTLSFAGGNFTASTPVTADQTVAVQMTSVLNDYFTIADKADWKEYCELVESGQVVNAKMTADVDLGTDVWIVGSTYARYTGTFDGQGHTLTVDWTADGYDQGHPFRILGEGATIKNLRVKGKIKSDNAPIAGLAGVTEGNVTISGCAVDVELTNGQNASHCLSGMVRWIHDGKVTFTDCVVRGTLNATTDEGKKEMGGFVGQQDGTCVLNNCLYAGTNNAGADSYTFARNAGATNSYYLSPCGTAQGTQAIEKELRNGVMTSKLQNGRTDDSHWAQVLGDMPDLFRAAEKNVVNYVYYSAANSRWTCENFVLTDGQPLPIGIDFTAVKATYERPFSNLHSATVCLPYELPVQGFQAHTISGGESNRAYFDPVTGTLEAYKPYYITANGTPQLGGTNLQVRAYTDARLTATAKGYKLVGTMDGVDNATAAAAKAYILQDDGKFHKVTTAYPEAVVPIYRAYITCPPQASGAKELFVVLDGVDPTGIDGVTNDAADANSPVYNLRGQRVADRFDAATRNSLPAGIYIVGGRKVIVK